MPWWLAGIAIGLLVLISYATLGRGLGVSGGFSHTCAILVRKGPFAKPAFKQRPDSRVTFLVGLALGGAIAAHLTGHAAWSLQMGSLTAKLATLPSLAMLLGGGLLIGLGTRLAGGCTSGHGITGSAELDPTSWVATATFMAVGVAVAHGLRLVWGL